MISTGVFMNARLKAARNIERWIRKIREFSCLVPIFLISMLHGASFDLPRNLLPDPYPQVYETIDLLPFNAHGWYPHSEIFEKIFQEREIKNIIEVGSWLGCSTRHFAQLIPEDGKVFAIDHWLGSKEHFIMDEVKDWIPVLYQQFLSNVIHTRSQTKSSQSEWKVLRRQSDSKLLRSLSI